MKFNYLFSLNIFWIFYNSSQINLIIFYLMYFVFFGLGIGLGYHRITCHDVKVNTVCSKIFVWLGFLCHVGSVKGSVVWHTQHHIHSGTDHDLKRSFWTALSPKLNKVKIPKKILVRVLEKYEKNTFYSLLDKYFYLVFIFSYFLLYCLFGFSALVHYFLAPAALALIIHSYSPYFVHGFGYQNYASEDNSWNSIWLFPFLFGENWHNNHHHAPSRFSFQIKKHEVDLIYFVGRLFRQ